MIFDATSYVGEPALGLPAVMMAGQWVWQGLDYAGLPPQSKCEEVARKYPFVVIDAEGWALAQSAANHAAVAGWMHAASPSCVVGAYMVPKRDYLRAIGDAKSLDYKTWQAENDQLAPAAAVLDWLCPSLYTFYDVSTIDGLRDWQRYAVANVSEARRIGAKSVVAFLWPEYHGSNKTLGGTYIPGAAFRAQLRTAVALCNHVIVWGGQNKQFDNSSGWFDIVKAAA